jgi:hypothetical protein
MKDGSWWVDVVIVMIAIWLTLEVADMARLW